MIRKFIDKILGKPSSSAKVAAKAEPASSLGQRVESSAAEHGIDPSLLDDRAVKVVATLKEAGFEAYIVGGAVRDLLVGRRPKDFDVATNATPEQVKGLFRRAFIIGRRFRIVHVIFGRGREHEVVEVSTFRAHLDASAAEQVAGNEKTSKNELSGKSHVVDATGRVLRDNVWGPQVEDAARRDFTVNAMYYDPTTQTVVDYHHGLKDVKARVLRMIGDPATRYREDPVRILRAVRFAAKLGFAIEPQTRAPIAQHAAALAEVPASRMFDEMVKLLQTGHGLASLKSLQEQGLAAVFPILTKLVDGSAPATQKQLVEAALRDTDVRVEEGRSVVPSFLLACVLWHEVNQRWQVAREKGAHVVPALQDAVDAVFDARIGDISGRGKLGADMREIWLMQPRFERRSGSGPYSLVEQPRFRAGYDFLRLRADIGEADTTLADWWDDFAQGSDEEREAMVAEQRSQKPPARVRRIDSGQMSAPVSTPVDVELAMPSGDAQLAASPARKRRRRRKPSGNGGGGETSLT
jgi:poly(A) polymerase